jgi:hypothetical protein
MASDREAIKRAHERLCGGSFSPRRWNGDRTLPKEDQPHEESQAEEVGD